MPRHLEVGDKFGRYRIDGMLGSGGMGVVYAATHLILGRPAAIKVLPPHLVNDAEFRKRFDREGRILAHLQSPQVVSVYDAGEEDDVLFIATELVTGGDLDQMVSDNGPLRPDLAAELAAEICVGLGAAHDAGVLHRDLKPSNVLLRPMPSGRPMPVLCDLGIARLTSADWSRTIGVVAGTPAFMAPERLEGAEATIASDIYSMGCLLWTLITGSIPYHSTSPAAILRGHLEGPIPQLPARGDEFAGAVRHVNAVLRVAMAKQPSDRFASAFDLRAALRDPRFGTAPDTEIVVEVETGPLGDGTTAETSDDPSTLPTERQVLIPPDEETHSETDESPTTDDGTDDESREPPDDGTAEETRSRVFISHRPADVGEARRLKAGLAERGLIGWLAPDDMVGRDSWAGELDSEIARCESFVVLLGSASLASKHVEREVTLAVEHDRLIVPVLIEQLRLTGPLAYLLSTRHWVEAIGGLSASSIDAIARRLAPGGSADPGAPPRGIPESARKPGKVAWDESRVPVPLDPIVGREVLVASVMDSVRAGRRLTTLRGPGGVGKTRVALEVARRVAEEDLASVVFADLSEATSASELMVGMANALSYEGPNPGNPAEVAKTLGDQPVLLVCDNLEQVAADTTILHQFLEAAPALVTLATSRTKLGLPGEDVVVVPPLELGGTQTPAEKPVTSPAVEMFLQVARHADPAFATEVHELAYIDRVCRALDGLPLALELAASRSAMMTPSQLWERVGSPVAQATIRPGAGRRHASVEATIEWSLSLLSPQALAGFARLGVFTGGFTLEAVERVCAADDEGTADVDQWLAELVDASVVQSADAPSGRRFFMLQLLLAEARRRPGDPGLDRRHATFYAELAEALGPDMVGPRAAAVTQGLADDLANWSQALVWASRQDPHLYCRLARGWQKVWMSTARPADVLASPLSPEARASLTAEESAVLVALSAMAAYLAGAEGALDGLEHAVEDSAALASDPGLLVLLLSHLAAELVQSGDRDRARCVATRAREYADEHGDVHDQAVANDVSGWVASMLGDLADARTFAERSIELAEGTQDDVGVCYALHTLGSVLIAEGDVVSLLACANRLVTLVQQGRGIENNHVQGEYLLRMAHIMTGDWQSAASSLVLSLTRPNPLPMDRIGDLLTAAAVFSAVGQLDHGHRALTVARQLAARIEADISEPEKPLLKHLARLEDYSGPTPAATEGNSSALPPDLLAALSQVAEKPKP